MGDELREQSWIFDMFILDRIDRELHSLERLELKFDSRLEFFYKIPVRILLDVLFGEFRFSKVSYMLWHLHSWHFKTSSPSWHCMRRTEACHGNFVITNYRWNFAPKLRRNSSPMILQILISPRENGNHCNTLWSRPKQEIVTFLNLVRAAQMHNFATPCSSTWIVLSCILFVIVLDSCCISIGSIGG